MRPLSSCRADFPSLSTLVDGMPLAFFDGPGGTQVPDAVIRSISAYYERSNANTHGAFATSIRTDAVIEGARAAAADFLGARANACISFGANMTTLNFALARAIGRLIRPGDEILVTQLDHEANRGPWYGLESEGAVLREVPLLPEGRLDTEAMRALITPRTRLFALGWASNAIGTVNEVELARELTRKTGTWLLVDAVHYAPHFAIDVSALDPDFLLCSAYKFYGPHVGILYAREGLLETLPTDRLVTQDQAAPYRIETGTLNHAALAGVTAAVDYLASFGSGPSRRAQLVSAFASLGAHERALAETYASAVSAIPGVRLWGTPFDASRRSPTVSVSVEGMTAREVTEQLARRALAVWDGDFYARRAVELFGLARRGGLVRVGMAMYTIGEEVDRLVDAMKGLKRG